MKYLSPTRLFILVLPLALGSVACAPRTIAIQPESHPSIEVVGQGEVFARNPQYPVPMPSREIMHPTPEEGEVTRAMPATPKKELAPSKKQDVVEGVYVVRNTMIVSVRDLDKLGDVIGAAMGAGANQMHGFELTIEDPVKLRDEARKKAVEQAIDKAKQLAKESNVKLGPVIEVREVGGAQPMPMMANARAVAYEQSAVPVQQGELSLSQSVQVVFAIDD